MIQEQTLVEAAAFTLQIPCFNVTSTGFEEATPSSSSTGVASETGIPASDTAPAESTTISVAKSSSSGGLSNGAIVGISIAVVAAIVMIAAFTFLMVRRRRSFKKDAESGAIPEMAKSGDALSIRSADTVVA